MNQPTNQKECEKSNFDRIRNLGIGESDTWPVREMDTVRSASYRVAKTQGKSFSTKTDSETITVTRTA